MDESSGKSIGTSATTPAHRAVSRRHFLAGATAAAGAAILAACGGSDVAVPTGTVQSAATTVTGAATALAPTVNAAATTVTGVATSVAPTVNAAASTVAGAATPAAAGGKGKALKMARNAEPQSVLIPWQIDDNPALFISVNMYDTLLRTTKDGLGVEPGLATKWEASADGLTWTFTLRDGLKFSDGTPVKGADVKTSLDQVAKGA